MSAESTRAPGEPASAPGALVTIGCPTYNRLASLQRAIASALEQTHPRVELIICDNASTDGTEQLCRRLADSDARVRYVRQPRNIGPTANFNTLFDLCDGDYVLMLADDDYLDPGYVAACLEVLRREPGLALVAGRARYHTAAGFSHEGVMHEHAHGDPAERVLGYLRAVDDNGVFYGLMPRAVVKQVRPLPNVLGNDWLHVARIAMLGGVRVLPAPNIHRALEGTSADVGKILATFQASRWQALAPQLVIAWQLLADIGWRHHVYSRLRLTRRVRLAVKGAGASIRWRHLAWHLLTPMMARLAALPGGAVVWQAYLRLTRALGAGRGPTPAATRR